MKIVSISGAVAAGKTTLLGSLLSKLGSRATCHEERPQDNPFIRAYYADSKRWSFHSQMTFLALYFDDGRVPEGTEFNCLFCYCPLYALGERCGGAFTYNEKGHKDWTHCMIPHRRENYGRIIGRYAELAELAKKTSES